MDTQIRPSPPTTTKHILAPDTAHPVVSTTAEQPDIVAGDGDLGGTVRLGTSPGDRLVEYVEYPREVRPCPVATRAHPELRSRPTRPRPLFAGLVRAAVDRITTVPSAATPTHR